MNKKSHKINSGEILAAIRDEQQMQEKQNTTFRLSVSLLSRFKDKCEKEDVSMAKVIEQLIKNFLEN